MRPLLAEARKAGTTDDVRMLETEWAGEALVIEEEQRQLSESKVLRVARRLFIPLPPHSDGEYWEESYTEPRRRYFLTVKGMNDLRTRIRAERKARIETRLAWVPLLTALTGLVGTLTGLIAMLLARR